MRKHTYATLNAVYYHKIRFSVYDCAYRWDWYQADDIAPIYVMHGLSVDRITAVNDALAALEEELCI